MRYYAELKIATIPAKCITKFISHKVTEKTFYKLCFPFKKWLCLFIWANSIISKRTCWPLQFFNFSSMDCTKLTCCTKILWSYQFRTKFRPTYVLLTIWNKVISPRHIHFNHFSRCKDDLCHALSQFPRSAHMLSERQKNITEQIFLKIPR